MFWRGRCAGLRAGGKIYQVFYSSQDKTTHAICARTCTGPLPRTLGTEKMAFPDPHSPLPPPPPPNPPLLLRISHLSLSFFVVVSESRRGVKVQQQPPMSRCLRASLLAIAPSLRTYMKKMLLLRSDGMDFGRGGGELFSDVLTGIQ